ncbi:MAG TPA: protein kinase [Verrucomicrobiae bacterium]
MQPTEGGDTSAPLAPGQLVGHGRYELLRMLDKGGMSSVWLAADSRLHEKVALKFLPYEIVKDMAAFREMQKETTKSRKLSHPNIVRIYDLHESPDETPFISMEYIEGENLHNLRHQQPHGIFTWEQIKPLVKQLCDALTYAHNEGLIHRDLKPANLMVDAKGRLKLADFGISMTADESRTGSKVKTITGTPGYMSPQQLSGQPAHITDDIHALGATLYELLSGRLPFSTGDINARVINATAKPLNETLWQQGLTNEVPPEASTLIMACLANDAAQRPASAKEIVERLDLKNIDEADASFTPSENTSEESDGIVTVKKNRLIPAIAVILVLVIAGVAAFALRPKPAPVAENQRTVEEPIAPPPAPPTTNSVSTNPATARMVKDMPGSLDESFNPKAALNAIVYTSARQPDGKYLVAGRFTKLGEANHNRIARFNADGSVDETFQPGLGKTDDEIHIITLQPDGKILVGGAFEVFNGQTHTHIVRLNADGSIDKSFVTQIPSFHVSAIHVLPDGKLFIAGRFTKVRPGEHIRNRLARLNPNGTVDESFNPLPGSNDDIDRIVIQKDGRILIAGTFTKIHGVSRNRIARLMPNGSLDTSFNVGTGLNSNVLALELQPDGKVLVGGRFTSFNDAPANYIVRLNPNGSRDNSFNVGTGANAFIPVIKMEGASRIWVGGNFTVFNGQAWGRLIRLKLDGSIDSDFANGGGANGQVRTLTYTASEGMFAAGSFTTFDGMPRPYLMRLHTGVLTTSKD